MAMLTLRKYQASLRYYKFGIHATPEITFFWNERFAILFARTHQQAIPLDIKAYSN